ncbi:hypothetical protein DF196_10060 [Bifidobacterium callitrichidarum]|uniref:DUF559 domain-containing protein n=2 Tax=Bifidobacterium callitrichidarum TaxID=2052941 RepID=A0A2U2N3G9_9BIFI|nr:hypothetical protein DF196_10060 [Bifidobacterium callitrichidarum]
MKDGLAQRKSAMLSRCSEAARRCSRTLLFGMTTSLILQSVPVPTGCGLDADELHVTSSSKERRIRVNHSNLRAHAWKPLPSACNVRIGSRVYALELAHTWAQLAPYLTLESLIVLGDSMLHAIASQPALSRGRDESEIRHNFFETITGLPPFKGKPRCLRAMAMLKERVASPKESESRLVLLRHGIPMPDTGYAVPDARFASGAAMTLDLAWPQYRIGVEYDGDQHRTDKAQWRRDQEKREWLRNRGWVVITLTGTNLADEVSKAEYAFNVARHLTLAGARFVFSVVPMPLEKVIGRRCESEGSESAVGE